MAAFQWKTDYTLLSGLRANGQKAKGRRRRSRQSFGNGTTASGTASTCVITLLMLHGRTRLIRIVLAPVCYGFGSLDVQNTSSSLGNDNDYDDDNYEK